MDTLIVFTQLCLIYNALFTDVDSILSADRTNWRAIIALLPLSRVWFIVIQIWVHSSTKQYSDPNMRQCLFSVLQSVQKEKTIKIDEYGEGFYTFLHR